MSVRERIRTWLGFEQRRTSTANPAAWFTDWLGGRKTTSGVRITSASALAYSAYFASIRNISEDTAKLPLHLYRTLKPRGKEIAEGHPVERLLQNPNPEMTAMSFRETMTSHALGWQGAFAEIQYENDKPIALWPLDPRRVSIRYVKNSNRGVLSEFASADTEIAYEVSMDTGGTIILASRNVLHIRGLGFDGITSYIIASIGAEALGTALAGQQFAGSFFGNGTNVSGMLTVPEVMSDESFENLRSSFSARHQGPDAAHHPVILEEGVTWTPTSQKASDAQMVEQRSFDVVDVARWFRMPPHKIQHLDRATFSNIEAQAIEYVTDTLMPWLVRWEQEIDRKLLPDRSNMFHVKHVVQALLRGDMAARSQFYREQFQVGAMSSNDIRELEDRNPIPGGDEYFVNSAMVTLELAADPPDPAPMAPQQPPQDEPDEPAGTAAAGAERGIRRAHSAALAAVLERVYALECEKIGRKGQEWYEHPERIEQVRRHVGTTCDAFVDSMSAVRGSISGSAVELCRMVSEAYVLSVRSRIVDGAVPADDDWIAAFAADQVEAFDEVAA